MKIIDAHQHFWSLQRGDYAWLTPALGELYRDHVPSDLEPLLLENEVHRTVLVQGAATESETHYLLALAKQHPFVAGVVGWTDFESADVQQRIANLASAGEGSLKGLRPMVQDIADPNWIARRDLDAAFEALIASGLAFDALVKPGQIDVLRERVVRHPHLRVVLDHAGKPDIAHGAFDAWAEPIERLAHDTNTCCKLSGLLTEAGARNRIGDLAPYVAHIFKSFGPERVLWGSDWPVLNRAGDYAHWLGMTRELVGICAPGFEDAVFGANALRFYKLDSVYAM